VLELACGPGMWTSQLLRYASDVTAVDASPEMIALAKARVGEERVRFIQADLFTWLVKVPHQPEELERRLRRLGWDITVTATAGPFYWGAGRRGEGLSSAG
jgi:SAM-dependent methyltransferase